MSIKDMPDDIRIGAMVRNEKVMIPNKHLDIQPNDESLEILDAHSSESRGIHNGVIINLDEAAKSIRSCLSNVEKKLKIYLRKINIVIEPQEFLCTRISKSKVVGGAKIQKEDISYLLKEAKKQTQLNNPKHSIIHIFNYNYFAD